jgi:hypothetical protein
MFLSSTGLCIHMCAVHHTLLLSSLHSIRRATRRLPNVCASNNGLPLSTALLGEWPRLPSTARIERFRGSLQACSFSLRGWGLIDLPLRATSQFPHSFSRVAWSILDCARRTSTFLSCAFREQEDGLATLPTLLRPRVARAQKIIRLHPFLRSASKEGIWPLPSLAS